METTLENHIDAGAETLSRPENPAPADAQGGLSVHGGRLAWENYARCLFLLGAVFFLGLMTWRNGSARFSLLLSLANPSLGESLAWKPADAPVAAPSAPKRVRPPGEWRLGSRYSTQWSFEKPGFKNSAQHAAALPNAAWARFSVNPWNWRNDVDVEPRGRNDDMATAQPPQKPASSFRAGDAASWPAATQATSSAPGDVLAAIPALPPLTGGANAFLNGQTSAASPFPAAPAALPGYPTTPAPYPATAPAAAPVAAPVQGNNPNQAGDPLQPLSQRAALPAPAAGQPAPEQVDWRNREITGPIPGAFLTIYPKLKFVGLCVPGQGYIRKYNQIGVPADLNNPKSEARDGRTPYGRYYIADRHRDADGARLFLSWPSPEDARRIGLDAGRLAQIDNAWRRQELPPQNTAAGGGVGLTGLRNWVETTEGGFSLEEPQMEEIFTALPDKAWVFIQP